MVVGRATWGLILATTALSGCAVLPGLGPRAVNLYDIGTPVVSTAEQRLSRTQILVPEPTALKVLDGEDIVIRLQGGAVQLLGGGRWSDRLPRLVQARLIETYQRSNRIGGVGRPGDGMAIDYQVILDIRAFEIRVDRNEHAFVELHARVMNDRNGVVQASRSFIATAPVMGTGTQAMALALDSAFRGVASEIVDWSLSVM